MKLGLDIKEPFGFLDSQSEEFDPYDIFLNGSLEQRNGPIDFDCEDLFLEKKRTLENYGMCFVKFL